MSSPRSRHSLYSLFDRAPLGQSLIAPIVLRLLLGLGEGVHISMLSAITSRASSVEGLAILMLCFAIAVFFQSAYGAIVAKT